MEEARIFSAQQKAFTLPLNGPKTTFPKQPETDACHFSVNKREAGNVQHHSYHRRRGVCVRRLSCSRYAVLRSAKSTSGRAGALSFKQTGRGSPYPIDQTPPWVYRNQSLKVVA
jgi:hypothetical protein